MNTIFGTITEIHQNITITHSELCKQNFINSNANGSRIHHINPVPSIIKNLDSSS